MSADRPEALPGKIAAALDRLARGQRAHRQAVATRHGLTPLQLDVLGALRDGPPPEPLVGLLATELGVAQPTVTDSVRALERKGLVRRHRDAHDGRRAALTLTAAGHRLASDLDVVDDALVHAAGALPLAVQEAVFEALLALIAHLVDTGAITVARTCLTCRYHHHDGSTHRCALLDVDLPRGELRVNCPEHQPA